MTTNLYVKNPNYNPLDPRSSRYVTDQVAQEQAAAKANSINDIFAPFTNLTSGLFKPYNSTDFYSPLAPNVAITPNATAVRASQPVQNSTPVPPNLAPISGVPQSTPPVPVTPTTSGYTVSAGDTLSSIAARNGTTVAALAAANGISDPNKIQVGQVLKLNGTAAPTVTGGAPAVAGAPDAQSIVAKSIQDATAANGGALTTTEISNLAKKAGEAGVDANTFMSLLQSNATPTTAQTDAIRSKLGIPNLVDEAFKTPDQTLVGTYKALYDSSGLNDIKTKIAALDSEIAQKRADLIQATGSLNNNPWISQGTRAGRLKNLQDLAYADINNSIDQKNSYLSLYDQGVSQIETQVNLQQADSAAAKALTTDHLNYLLNEAERQTKGVQQDTITQGLRSIPDFLQGVLNRESTTQARDLAKIEANKAPATDYGTINGKPQTAAQAKVNTYATRMTDANDVMSTLGDQFASSLAFGAFLPNQLQSADRQRFEQAKLNFVNALLRQESGAVIGDSEYVKAEKQYFPQAGDSAEVLAQKAANRETVISGMYNEANKLPPSATSADVTSADAEYLKSLGL